MRRARSFLLLAAVALACGATMVAPGVANAAFPPGFQISGDFNNDGIPDVAILNPAFTKPCTVTLEPGTGNGTFGSPTVYTFDPGPEGDGECPNIGVGVKVGTDTSLDLVVTWQAVDVPVLLVLRNGDFQPAGEFGGIIEPDFIRTADLNGDGRQDLILSSNQVTTLATFFNNADGTITSGPETCSFGLNPQYALADFNGDGGQDILLSGVCPMQRNVLTAEVLFSNGQLPAVLATSTDDLAKFTVFPIDLNFDGSPDVGVIEVENGVTTVQYFVNDRHGHFTPFGGNGIGPANPFLADITGDGIPDLVTLGQLANTTTCTVTVQRGKSDGGFAPPAVHQYTTLETRQPFCPTIGAAVKLGNHSRPDLVTAFPTGSTDMMVIHQFQPTKIFTGIIQPDWIRSAALTGDGRVDIIEGSSTHRELGSFTNNADGTLTPGSILTCSVSSNPQYVLADFNGDGGQDIFLSQVCPTIMPSDIPPDHAEILFGNGQAPVTLATGSATYTVFALDLNYDGIPDAGVISTLNGVTSVQYFSNDGHGNFTPLP